MQAFFPQSFLVSSLPHSFGLGAEKFSKKDLFIIPIVAVLITLAVLLIFKIKLTALDYFEPVFNYGFLGLSIIFLIANYFIQYKKVN